MRLWIAISLLAFAAPARAHDADGGAPPEGAVAPAQPAPVAATPPKDALDFNLLDTKPSPAFDPKAAARVELIRKQVLVRRRTLLTHQVFGILTVGLLVATVIAGSLDYYDKFGGGSYTLRYEGAHEALALGSAATFATTAALGLFAPTPYKKPIKADAALAHKLLMGAAAACFIAELILGPVSESQLGNLAQRNFAGAHVGLGVGALATMTAGWLAFVIH